MNDMYGASFTLQGTKYFSRSNLARNLKEQFSRFVREEKKT